MIEFKAWPKTPRLFRDMVITEKIDGTNTAVVIEEQGFTTYEDGIRMGNGVTATAHGRHYIVAAQSRSRLIDPESDNFGFAKWVYEHAADLAAVLGEGRHYGEWWGSGIQRGYGMAKGAKKFSLFNVNRYADLRGVFAELDVVPTLYQGPFDLGTVKTVLATLKSNGSYAADGFMNPEGLIVFHEAANQIFKVTLEGDDKPKGLAETQADYILATPKGN